MKFEGNLKTQNIRSFNRLSRITFRSTANKFTVYNASANRPTSTQPIHVINKCIFSCNDCTPLFTRGRGRGNEWRSACVELACLVLSVGCEMHGFSGLLIYILSYPTGSEKRLGRKFTIDIAHDVSIQTLKPLPHNRTKRHICYIYNYDLHR